MKGTAENRNAQRFKISQIVEIELSHETFFSALGRDLSCGGMQIETGHSVEPHSRIFTMLKLGEDEQAPMIKAEGIVVHVAKEDDGFSCGVQFTGMSQADKTSLIDYLKSCSDDFPA